MYDFGNDIDVARWASQRIEGGVPFNMRLRIEEVLSILHPGGIYGYERCKFGGVGYAHEDSYQSAGEPLRAACTPSRRGAGPRVSAVPGRPDASTTCRRVMFTHDI